MNIEFHTLRASIASGPPIERAVEGESEEDQMERIDAVADRIQEAMDVLAVVADRQPQQQPEPLAPAGPEAEPPALPPPALPQRSTLPPSVDGSRRWDVPTPNPRHWDASSPVPRLQQPNLPPSMQPGAAGTAPPQQGSLPGLLQRVESLRPRPSHEEEPRQQLAQLPEIIEQNQGNPSDLANALIDAGARIPPNSRGSHPTCLCGRFMRAPNIPYRRAAQLRIKLW